MAKKLLAVVLAVLIATSAMAITLFADTQIPLYQNKSAWQGKDPAHGEATITFDIPMYGAYGYFTAGDYMNLRLPTKWGYNLDGISEVKWSIIVDGVKYDLPTQGAPQGGTNTQDYDDTKDENGNPKNPNGMKTVKIALGYFAHSWDGQSVAIPQSTAYEGAKTIRLVATMTWPNGATGSWRLGNGNFVVSNGNVGAYALEMRAQWYKADNTPVLESVTYAKDWNPTVDFKDVTTTSTYAFVTSEWTDPDKNNSNVPLAWDHTLANRMAVMSAESIQLVVELNKPISGRANYTLYSNTGSSYAGEGTQYWWQYDGSRQYVAKVEVDGTADKLVFDVPTKYLYDYELYGTFNKEFVIFENIILMNNAIMKNYMEIDRSKTGGASGVWESLSWDADWTGNNTVKYKGANVNYARTGVAGKDGAGVNAAGSFKTANEMKAFAVTKRGGGLTVDTQFKVTKDQTVAVEYVFTGTTNERLVKSSTDWAAGTIKSDNGADVMVLTYDDMIKAGAQDGQPIAIQLNSWGGNEYEGTIIVRAYNDNPSAAEVYSVTTTKLKGDVEATAIYLNIKDAEVDTATPDTPTEAGDNTEDVEGDNVNVEDNTPAPAEKNPTTGVALAVVPMLVAAVAAVLAKKH